MNQDGHQQLLKQRRQARADAVARLERLRRRHLDEVLPDFCSRLPDALAMVDLWERRQSCSRAYIDRWRALLDAGPNAVTEAICGDDALALLQNSPFYCPADGLKH